MGCPPDNCGPLGIACCKNAHFVERIAVFVTCFVIVSITFRFTRKWCLQDEIDIRGKAVLITGCDSGFGFLLAQKLDKKGFKVFASCLFPCGQGASELKATLSERSKIFGLDVRRQESIHHALKFVKQNLESCELWAIINNAGIQKVFSLELSNLQDFQETMEVNAFGHVRVTKTFLNLLRPAKGRIINITSICSTFPLPYLIPYCMSKYAAKGFSDCLRAELANTGIKVISVEPTGFRSEMTEPNSVKKTLEESISEKKEEVIKNCGNDQIENIRKLTNFLVEKTSKDIYLVVKDLEHAVCCQYPEIVYYPCPSIIYALSLKLYSFLPPFIQEKLFSLFTNFL